MQLIHQRVGARSGMETKCLDCFISPRCRWWRGWICEDLSDERPRLAWEEKVTAIGAEEAEDGGTAAGGSEGEGQI